MILSIITVTLNCVETIERTIQSIISQKCEGVEYIVIDGGSTDGTLQVLEKYSDYIDYWVSEYDNGIYSAMNKGIKVACGKWINFMNGNDWYEKNAINSIISILNHTESNLVYGKIKIADSDRVIGYAGAHKYGTDFDPEIIHFKNVYCHQGLFIKREMFNIIGLYNENYKIISDYEWIIKAHNLDINPIIVDIEVGYFAWGGISCSKQEDYLCLQLKMRSFHGGHLFSAQLEFERNKIEYKLLCHQNPYIFKALFDQYHYICMWGIGSVGRECLDLLNRNSIDIKYVLTNEYKNESWNGLYALHYSNYLNNIESLFDGDILILISTEKYEKEIVEILKQYSNKNLSYITMSFLYGWAHQFRDTLVY